MASMDWFNLPLDKKNEFLQDKRLTSTEKTVLECSILLRENKFELIIKTLNELTVQNLFVDSQRFLVLGVAYNVSGNCSMAVESFNRSIHLLKDQHLPNFEFTANLQLFFAYLNLKQKLGMAEVLDRMSEIISNNVWDKISLLRCKLNYHLYEENYEKAKTDLKNLRQVQSHMRPGQKIFFLVDQFSFYLKIEKYKKCEEVLEELKRYRTYKTSENFIFMQTLLKHYLHKKPIYIDDLKFSKTPLLFSQIQVIKALESGNNTLAKKYWDELAKLTPETYVEFMEYKGDKCLFSLCLSLYQKRQQKDVSQYLPSLSTTERKLILLLANSTLPISKEDLYFQIYDENYESKDDLQKLSLLCSRIRYKTGLSIKSSKGSYSLAEELPKTA